MKTEHKSAVMTRLRTARGQLDAVVGMVERDEYCPDVMKQLSAVQGLIEAASRTVLRNHLETCVADGIRAGHTEDVVGELMEALKYDRHTLRPSLSAVAVDGAIEPVLEEA